MTKPKVILQRSMVGGGPRGVPEAVSGVQLAQGIGVQEAKGFWADAWSQVLRRPGAVAGIVWISIVLFFAIFSPVLASGHPLILRTIDVRTAENAASSFEAAFRGDASARVADVRMVLTRELLQHSPRLEPDRFIGAAAAAGATGATIDAAGISAVAAALRSASELNETGAVASVSSPLWRHLSSADVLLILGGIVGPIWMLLPIGGTVGQRLGALVAGALQAGLIVVACNLLGGWATSGALGQAVRGVSREAWFPFVASGVVAAVVSAAALWVPSGRSIAWRVGAVALVGIAAWLACGAKWTEPLERFDYRERAAAGRVQVVYTLVPFSPNESSTAAFTKPPGTRVSETLGAQRVPEHLDATYVLGTDAIGQDVLTQMMHACRLSISIGLVSTSIAVFIGVTIGAIMGYFGGWVDLLLYRVVEIFMSVPVLFLLIVAAGVLPEELRTTYVTMAIIGLFTWTGAARFTRAEFLKLRNQDFVQSARAVGLPLRSILFKHMLPNGVTPVLVDTSFAIAAAILIESVLSYLNLGPVGQPSWGKLLFGATGEAGLFNWWLAIFPGAAIFLTVLAYNLIGEALRDAIDPKLKKARV